MKRLNLLGIVLLMVCFFSNIAGAAGTDAVNGRFIGGVGLGGAAPVNGFGSAYSGGGGVDGYLGFMIDKHLSALLAIDSFIFNTSDSNVYVGEVNFAPSLKYAFGDSGTRFYLIGGLGLNDDIAYFQGPSGTVTVSDKNFVVEPGAGVEIFLNGALDLYIQAKYINVFAADDFSYIPISIGLCFK